MAALARELRAALLPRPKSPTDSRRPEWKCQCGATNWLERSACRKCTAAKPAPRQATPTPKHAAVLRAATKATGPAASPLRCQPVGSVWGPAAAGKPATVNAASAAAGSAPPAAVAPAARRAALVVALEAVRAAGGCAELEQSVSQVLSQTVQAAADSRPLGARLDSCKARLAKTEARVAQAAAAAEQAATRHAEAVRDLEACQAALAELEREVATPPVRQPAPLATEVQDLLAALESCTNGLPEPVLGCMRSLHLLLGNLEDAAADSMSEGGDGNELAEQHAVSSRGGLVLVSRKTLSTPAAAQPLLLASAEVARDGEVHGPVASDFRSARAAPY